MAKTSNDLNVARTQDIGSRPAAPYQVMPPLSADEYEALRADIAEHGVRVPVDVDEHGAVLDGHHRVSIAAQLGVDCPTRIVDGLSEDSKRGHALAVNLARRQLTREQKRDLIAAEIEHRPEDSDRAIARRLQCSPSTVGTVRLSKLDTAAPTMSVEEAERFTQEAARLASDYRVMLLDALVRKRWSPAVIAQCIQTVRTRFWLDHGDDDPNELRAVFEEMFFDYWLDEMAGCQAVLGSDVDWEHDDARWGAWLDKWGRTRPDGLRESTRRWLDACAPDGRR